MQNNYLGWKWPQHPSPWKVSKNSSVLVCDVVRIAPTPNAYIMSLQIWHFLYELCCLSLLYFANKVNLEKSHKSAKCVCYHQIRATKMEQVINSPWSFAKNWHWLSGIQHLESSPYFFGIFKKIFGWEVMRSVCIHYSNRSQASWTRSK